MCISPFYYSTSQMAKVYVTRPTCGHELWGVTNTTRTQRQASKMSFPHWMSRLSLRVRVESSDIQTEQSQLR